MDYLMVLIVIGTAIWVYFDAKSIGVKKGQNKGFFDMGPAGWCGVTLLIWIVGFPAWLGLRGKYKKLNASKACPYCAELIKKEAVVCLHCKRDIPMQI